MMVALFISRLRHSVSVDVYLQGVVVLRVMEEQLVRLLLPLLVLDIFLTVFFLEVLHFKVLEWIFMTRLVVGPIIIIEPP
jgi:hypothetical protein